MPPRSLARLVAVSSCLAAFMALSACTPAGDWHPGSVQSGSQAGADRAAAGSTFTLTAVGDTIMGSAPQYLPPNGGADFFAPVRAALKSDLQMANLEQPLTDVSKSTKCSDGSAGKTCFAFRSPTSYAAVLKSAGFDVVNLANNHALDFGQAGHEQTEECLQAAGVRYTGPPGVTASVGVKGIRVAVIGFAPYPWANDLRDIDASAALVRSVKQSADVVIVQAHMGAEGAAYQHVKPGVQTFLGENRGDVIGFSHAMIDAGADIVIGHGPHVLRGMEFYKGHLIAYSLGNFAGYHALSSRGATSVSMILRATMRADGSLVSARIVPASMVAPGVPRLDPKGRAIPMIQTLTSEDFGSTGARIADDGEITAP
jgi:poly-gamma-glutamate capsule biosynthesis protein CapA/YwtB (metallophosphatase superfamily)